ncbi:uncharacterized protein SPAPADRAFT_137238 [Spathaspora passalidarum NRRL Y-27907]|uniref:Uncharacterized protein n=1 Tax=Spathaspora passalidarum (strain NRRL Y-27907 / 11-Y1) TaxID=619300 RepID=G3ALD7_SPAPN|nr:uncharacterized protein SPAPADRAFT_137238 [Spathaspora passalidarum NRRL Y-27907]EGW33180.1 hypothetical protein SPAPADRAFT_137238 [Spathaspora passalidarum NRRL Y-27907]
MSHQDLLTQAKQNQINDLRQSTAYSKQLATTIHTLIRSNSSTSNSLIDKITTIHQLNNEIDRQLNNDLAKSYTELMKYKRRLNKVINECHAIMYHKDVSIINKIQSRVELIDQDLRILEQTLTLVKR